MEFTKSEYEFKGYLNCPIAATAWIPSSPPVSCLHIIHGMTEHIGRYKSLAERLASRGILVIGMDLRGHGRNKGDRVCASMGKKGWEASLEDISFINRKLKEAYPFLPLAVMGFSLGSFILRDYLSKGGKEVSKAIIAGTGTQNRLVLKALIKIVRGEIKKSGFDSSTPLVKKLSFQTYNEKFKPNRTSADWLCSDEDEIDLYLGDELCRKEISAGLFYELLSSMERNADPKTYKSWNKDMPILLISGENDPVGSFGKGIKTIERQMQKADFKNVSAKLIKASRHDIFHENKNGGAFSTEEAIEAFL